MTFVTHCMPFTRHYYDKSVSWDLLALCVMSFLCGNSFHIFTQVRTGHLNVV
jgi:hypothetical protein